MQLVLVATLIDYFLRDPNMGMNISMVSCVSMCRHDTSCIGFFYSRQEGRCYLADSLYSDAGTRARRLIWRDGYVYFEYKNEHCHELSWHYHRPSQTCFTFPHIVSEQPAANETCTSWNSSLLSLDSSEKLTFYNKLAEDNYECIWTSATNASGSWRWGNGELIELQDWDDEGPEENGCMCVDGDEEDWEDKPCYFGHRFVCERHARKDQESCSQTKFILP